MPPSLIPGFHGNFGGTLARKRRWEVMDWTGMPDSGTDQATVSSAKAMAGGPGRSSEGRRGNRRSGS